MRTIRHLDDIRPADRGHVIAIGNFDGVHKGHQALLDRAKGLARSRAVSAGVLIFEPHPRFFFRPDDDHFPLTPLPRKLERLAHFDIDFAVVVPFDRALAGLSAEAFVDEVLADALGVAHV
ncbi:MAG: adenylyltransferase/cytidyltransferase family protein, partial [Pseudomonadota bacterium]